MVGCRTVALGQLGHRLAQNLCRYWRMRQLRLNPAFDEGITDFDPGDRDRADLPEFGVVDDVENGDMGVPILRSRQHAPNLTGLEAERHDKYPRYLSTIGRVGKRQRQVGNSRRKAPN